MNTRKTEGEKAVPAGISLSRNLIERGRAFAYAGGYGGLSGLTRHLLTTYLADAGQSAQDASGKAERKRKHQVKKGVKKMRGGGK